MAAQYRGKVSFAMPGAGLVVTGTFQTSGSTAQGSSTIVATGTTSLTGTINAGDKFTCNGTTYTCTAPATASANLVTIPVTPTVPGVIPTATAITAYVVDVYAYDLAFLAPQGASAAAGNWGVGSNAMLGLTVCCTAIANTAAIELWIFDPTASDPTNIANYYLGVTPLLTAVGSTTVALASVSAVLVRAKGNGTAGTTTILYYAD